MYHAVRKSVLDRVGFSSLVVFLGGVLQKHISFCKIILTLIPNLTIPIFDVEEKTGVTNS